MTEEIDILALNVKILSEFEEDLKKIPIHKQKLEDLNRALKLEDISINAKNGLKQSIEQLEIYIKEVTKETQKNFYIVETAQLIKQYKSILKTPMKVNFMGKVLRNDKEKQEIIREYLEVAKNYVDIYTPLEEKKKSVVCTGVDCGNKSDFDIIDNNVYICLDCGVQQKIFFHTSSYKDIDRVNISVKYTYDRKVHFRDCINQYQGVPPYKILVTIFYIPIIMTLILAMINILYTLTCP